MKLVNRANLSADALAALDARLPRVGTLLDVMAWADMQRLRVASAVTQDEFTHDVVLEWGDGLWLVFGAT